MLPMNELLQEGRYRVSRQLGHNETGSIFEGFDNILERKIFINHFTYNGRKNLSEDEKVLKGIKHESFLRVTDYFAELSGWFCVMESEDGEFLSDILNGEKRQFDFAEVLKWTEQILDGFSYLHLNLPPIVYGDLKPQNIFVTSGGQVKLLASAILRNRFPNTGLTKLSETALNYSPLEQIWGSLDSASQKVIVSDYDEAAEKVLHQPMNARSDIYSLGVLMYRLLTGNLPKNALERSIEILENSVDPLDAPDKVNGAVPPEISDIIVRALRIRRENRLDSAVIMRQILRTAFVRIKERESSAPPQNAVPQPAKAQGSFETFTLDDYEGIKPVTSAPKVQETPNAEVEAFAMTDESVSENIQNAPEIFETPVEPEAVKKSEKPTANFFDFDEEDEEEILGALKPATVSEAPKVVEQTKPLDEVKPVEKTAAQEKTAELPKVENKEEAAKVSAPVVEMPEAISVKEAEKVVPEVAPTDYKKDYAPAEFGTLFEDAEIGRRSKFSVPVVVLVLFLIGGGAVGVWFFAMQNNSTAAVKPDANAPLGTMSNAPSAPEVKPSEPVKTEAVETQPVSNAPETASAEPENSNPVLEQETTPTAKKQAQSAVKPKPAPAKPQTASAKPAEKQPKKVTVDDLINDN